MNRMNARLWSGFWQLADPKIWIASTVPMLIATALAYNKEKSLDWGWVLLALVGIYLIEIGKNAVNEFIDYWTGVDRYIATDKRNPFSGGKKTIIDGKLSMLETAIIAVITLALAFFIGLYIALVREPNVFWIGMIGGFLAVFYSLPPFKFNYNGLGEAAVGLSFGPLIVLGMYAMLTGELDANAAFIGLPLAFLITAVLWINQYPDYEADMKGGKRNWLVRIGKARGIKVYAWLYAGAYVSIAAVALASGNYYWLLGLLTIPIAVQAVRIAALNLDNLPQFLTANARTVMIYQLTGAAMIAAALLA
ncbi:prenyltransferase [Paenibacillus camelliae]|uniref:prenyltransferase n=1 Tax=Paenibacillus camelliae TaxID=512410 RepID=UPI00203EC7B6|nr:prenyltransferase [Paenibacillus camelliae]MCM3634101.1 prenyltransferase [Paenibacillus camelliae]